MKLFDKRNIVLIMSIFLLLLMVSSVSAADVSEDAVVGNDAAIDTITSTDTDTGSIDDVISAEVSDNPKVDPSDSNESLSGDIVADASSNNDNSNENSVDDSSQDVLKASSDDEIISIDIPEIRYSIHVSPSGSDNTGDGTEANPYATLSEALRHLTYSGTSTYEIVLHGGTYTGTSAQADIRRATSAETNFKYLLIRAADGENVVMDGGNRRQLWSVHSENVVIQGITFVNASGSGAALEIQRSHVAVDNCTFIHCGGDNAIGGAVHIQGYTTGTWPNQVQHNVTDFNFTNCNFEQCYARVGGCMRTELTSSGVNLIGCNFTNNTATKHGAVTCLYGDGVLIENCMVVNNTASSAAGIQMHTADSVIKNTTFIGNNATGTGIGDDYGNGYGGAIGLIYNTTLGATIDGCTFINNSAAQDGGAINIEGKGANAIIINSNFTNNTAPKGGAIIISGNNSIIDNCTFFNNTANESDGGAVYIDGRDTTLNNVTLANNTAAGNGAGVLIDGTNTHITDSTVENNTAGGSGAGLYVDGRNTVIDGCDISNNNATVNGGGAYLIGSDATISNSNFTANNAIPNEDNIEEGLGGSVYVAGNNGHINGCDFTNNTARNGSAIYVNPENPSNENYIDNCTLVDNQAWTYWMPIIYNTTHIESNITGGNNILNAIYNNGPNTSIFINGTNPVLGWENSDNGTITYQDDREAYQNISVVVYDTHGNVVYNDSAITGLGGNVTFELGEHTSDWFFVVMTHEEDTYYKYIVNATGIDIKPNITISSVVMYEGNETPQPVFVVIADGSANAIMLAGNITVYVKYNGDTLIANGTAKQGYFMFEEEEVFKTMPVGEYELTAVFNYIDKVWDERRQTYTDVPKQVSGTGELIILPYEWELTKTIVAVNGQPYVEGMEIHVNDNITFNITVKNNVDADITSVKITDLDTVNLTYVSYEGSGWQKVDGANVWTLDNLPANGNSSLMVTFNILNYGNSINVANASIFSDKYNKSANATFKVTHVELGIVKTANPVEVYVGQEITFTIEYINNGDGTAHNVTVTDEIDTDVFKIISYGDGTLDGNVITWKVGDLAPGATGSVSVVVQALNNGTFNNTAVITCNETENKTNNSTTVTVLPYVSLEIIKESNATTAVIGEEIDFTITVINNGLSNATNVNVTDILQEGFAADFSGEKIIPLIEPGKNVTFHIIATAAKAGTWDNTANATCTENNTLVEDTVEGIVVNRLTITISVGNYTTTPGTTVPVEITVVDQRGNPVPSLTLTVVVTGPDATDSLPPHEGKLVFTFTTDLGADGGQVTTDSEGKATYEYTVPEDATDGTSYTVTASSEETDKYAAAEGTGYVDVIQYKTTTTISDASGKPGETVTLDVEVTTEDGTPFNGDVVITCPDGKKVTVTVKDGKGQFDWTIPEDAKAGDEYQFTATFEGNSTYLASSGNGTVTVEEPEPKPEPPVPVPEPEPEEPVVTPAKMLNTGNPLIALLAAFVLIGLGLKRREEE